MLLLCPLEIELQDRGAPAEATHVGVRGLVLDRRNKGDGEWVEVPTHQGEPLANTCSNSSLTAVCQLHVGAILRNLNAEMFELSLQN